ncbi:bifunctional glycosyltransferase family 2 protein/CDP-glycerol:glycerophosphate glycerophosphotransferase [Nonomuraea sp. NBC_01738]|uniref:bifunctional glycosyltransferase/CDP-glycerol:glycerophosphate glycerophosphotransferase n=1 Tax=Nonomuraea sp. NBC_01738 TaxID=2976003 RepID=UPI002E10573E|nr:bifunctional glycosyltransferase family 2 protein/CDP-glycerol:glycerophosphate glycerophosphotransferase [Nonomuraea sp. NBC_01738]
MSVVVPIYDVETYLGACLESLAAQTLRDLEVVMVDDGSPDGSVDIAARFAERDRRFRLVRQANAGLGAARNTGIRQATGEFLAFLDSDDVMPLHALESMAATLDETGSSLVTGNVLRFNSREVHQSPMHKMIFIDPVRRTHVTRQEILLKDRLVTNKLWRRSFWDGNGLEFPEGVLYEDTFVALRGHFLADAVDMTPVPVYLWREREGGNLSITQDRAQVKAIEDRILSVRSVRRFLVENGWQDRVRAWDRMVLQSDLTAFLTSVAVADAAYQERFLDVVNEYLGEVADTTFAHLPADRRAKWDLVRERRLDDLAELMDWERSTKPAERVSKLRRSYYLSPPVRLAPRSARLRDDLEVTQRVDSLGWEDGNLVIQGRATLRYLSPDRPRQQYIFAWLVNERTGKRIKLQRAQTRRPSLNGSGKDWSGFELVVDPRRLPAQAGEWHVDLAVLYGGRLRRARLAESGGQARHLDACRVDAGGRVWIAWDDSGQLRVHVGQEVARVTTHRLENGTLTVEGVTTADLGREPVVRLTRSPGNLVRTYPIEVTPAGFRFNVPLEELVLRPLPESDQGSPLGRLLETPGEWRAEVDGAGLIGAGSDGRYGFESRDVMVTSSGSGQLTIRDHAETLFVREASWNASGALVLRGETLRPVAGPVSLALRPVAGPGEHTFAATAGSSQVTAELSVLGVESLAGRLPLPTGEYGLDLRLPDGRRLRAELCREAVQHKVGERELTFTRAMNGDARLVMGNPLRPGERGGKRQRWMREHLYPELTALPLRDTVFFDSYTGKQFSDNPKAVYEDLLSRGADFEMLWNVRDHQAEVPDGAIAVRTNSREYFEALATSRYIITNAHLPAWFRRREGQAVVQTWHGTTLKRIGFDIESVRFASADYQERIETEVRQWTHLVSPSPWCTPILRRAFRFEGEMLESGYPRNDVLWRPEVADRVRERLGLPEGRKVVLYAPTWRDDEYTVRGQYRCDLRLDLERLRRDLGDDHLVLVRTHPNVTALSGALDSGFALDVSLYPDIQELYLVADVLITDYSSAMFDFAVTGKPLLFYTYDLEHYRDTLRGFYFDFEAEAPGPLLRTTGDVAAALAGLDEVNAKYAGLYAAFRRTYCPLDDGGAAARVVDRVFHQWSRSGMDISQ